jgi:hypothetical protein
MGTLRDRLRERKPPTATVRIPVDPGEHLRAEQELGEAEWQLEQARSRGSADVAELRARAAAARAVFDALDYEQVTLRALPPAEWEGLVDLHPPTEEQRQTGLQWNLQTFRSALLAAVVVTPDGEEPRTEAAWDVLTKEGSLTTGELNMLVDAAVSLNLRMPQVSVGKG